jgi:hypothetical protein
MAATLRGGQKLNAAFDRRADIIAVPGLQTATVCKTATLCGRADFRYLPEIGKAGTKHRTANSSI